jgi:glycosyltransferase involved in cell wall biosynthesis
MWNMSPELAYWAEKWIPKRVAYSIASYWLIEGSVHQQYWQRQARHSWAEKAKSFARSLALAILARERDVTELQLEHVTCVSNHVRRRLAEAHMLPHGCHVIYNGIDTEPFVTTGTNREACDGPELRLVYVGGILPHKGVHTAIEALGLLEQRSPGDRLHLELIGGGHPDYIAQLHRRIAELGLDEQVTFHGRVPRDQIPCMLARARVFLFTSIWEEPIARSVMEAMAAGLAVIATPVGGQREMLEDGVNALLYRPDDADQLAACIERLRDDRDLCTQLGAAGRRTVLERFTLDRMVDEMESWLQSMIAGCGAPVEPAY